MSKDRIDDFFKNRKFRLATVKNESNILLYVDDLEAWEKDTNYGEYEEEINSSYNKIIIILEGYGFEISRGDECTGKNYGLNAIVRDYNVCDNKICIGSTINDLYAFLKRVRGTSNIYIPYEFIGNKDDLKRKDLKLCYIENNVAYFTNNKKQYGEDWSRVPYEHNAGTPYEEEGFEILKLGFYTRSKYFEPCNYFYNKHFSVEEINCKFVPWLIPESVKYKPIFAGENLKGFVRKIKDISGDILYGIQFENYNY